jgi:uncharacterized protein YecT (DUF1311 family)
MTTKIILTVLCIFHSYTLFCQGHIDNIKNQKYLKDSHKVDCNNLPAGDNAAERICANLKFQKTDSILIAVYDSLRSIAAEQFVDSLEYQVIEMQTAWRALRDQHCRVIYDSYEGCAGCHERSIAYLLCLTELTEDRINQLRLLTRQLGAE